MLWPLSVVLVQRTVGYPSTSWASCLLNSCRCVAIKADGEMAETLGKQALRNCCLTDSNICLSATLYKAVATLKLEDRWWYSE